METIPQRTRYSTHEEVALRAYRLWQERGCPIGSPEVDWFRAEEEIRSHVAETNLNGWFATQVAYEGVGRAEFTAPQGAAEGPTTITFDKVGGHSVEMFVEKLEFKGQMELGAMQFFSGQRAVKRGANLVVSVGAHLNPCSKLTVKCANGTFLAENKVLYEPQFSFGDGRTAGSGSAFTPSSHNSMKKRRQRQSSGFFRSTTLCRDFSTAI